MIENEEKYRTLIENINVGIYRNTGPDGKFIEANPAIIKMFGYKNKTEFQKMKVADLYYTPKDRDRFNAKMLKNGFVKNEELLLWKKDGTSIIASVSSVAVRDKEGKYIGTLEVTQDITEIKKLEGEKRLLDERD